MHKTHRLSRLASLGLGAVLLALTVFAIYAAVTTFDVISQTTESVHITDLYQQAQYLIKTQESLEWQYQVQPTSDVRTQFRATAAQLITTLQLVSRVGNASDRARAEGLITKEKRYVLAVNRMFAAMRAAPVSVADPLSSRNGWFQVAVATIPINTRRIADAIKSAAATGRHLLEGSVPVGNNSPFSVAIRKYSERIEPTIEAQPMVANQRCERSNSNPRPHRLTSAIRPPSAR